MSKDIPVVTNRIRGLRFGFFSLFQSFQIPATVEELPGQLEGDKGLARTGCHCQQDTGLTCRNRFQYLVYGIVLIVAGLPASTPVLQRE